ncbi:MAG: D-alanyl-D-alanine carboxypeptidase [Alphaproteobacteria bacterium]|nr:D-alanyl-D-alanine carboxypeptidase [Alphaproteobacteria bacterium]
MVLLLVVLLGTAGPAMAGYASMVMDADTGAILQAQGVDNRNYPASLTKMMTLYLAFEGLESGKFKLNTPLPVSARATKQAPSRLGVMQGQTITMENAILALVTKSANDVACVIAEAVGGTEPLFAAKMTTTAHRIGMAHTEFRNASGLPHKGQVTTARDMATLARALIRTYPQYYHYFSTRQFQYGDNLIHSHNRVMLNYPGADGLKTGYIAASGFNLVTSAKRDGRRLIGVVLGGRTAKWRDRRMADLLDAGFAHLNGQPPGKVVLRAPPPPAEDLVPVAAEVPVKLIPPKASAPVRVRNVAAEEEPHKAHPAAVAETGSWGVQLGIFHKQAQAHAAAVAGNGALGDNAGKILVVSAHSRGKTQYMARIVSMSKKQAKAACSRMGRHKSQCRVVTPSGELAGRR